jgi:predicted nucleic acid-binding protein
MIVLLDTSVVIDALNARAEIRGFLQDQLRAYHTLACCAITVAEVHAGMRRHEVAATCEFLDALDYYETTRAIARRAGDLKAAWSRKGQTLSLPDVLIAAVALECGLALATANRKQFPMPELKLLPLP